MTLFSFLFLLSQNGFANKDLHCIKDFVGMIGGKSARVYPDTPVELEMTMSIKLMDLLTTKNGKLSGVFQNKEIPKEIQDWIRQRKPGFKGKVKDFPWDELNHFQKVQVLDWIQISTDVGEVKRVIPGIIVKDKIKTKVTSPVVFNNHLYQIGEHDIPLKDFLVTNEVHLVPGFDSETQRQVFDIRKKLEFHFRPDFKKTSLTAGKSVEEARNLQRLLGLETTHQHAHVLLPIDIAAWTINPKKSAKLFTEFSRRVNFLEELKEIKRGYSLRSQASFSDTHISQRYSDLEKELTEHLRNKFSLKKDFKSGFVGVRGADLYSATPEFVEGSLGLEFRNLHKETLDNPKLMLQTKNELDHIQSRAFQKDFGINYSEIENTPIAHYRLAEISNKNKPVLQYDLISSKIKGGKNSVLRIPEKIFKDHHEIEMLYFDWSKDPLFASNKQLLQKITLEQNKAIQQIEPFFKSYGDGGMSSEKFQSLLNPIIQDFIKNCEIETTLRRSLGF